MMSACLSCVQKLVWYLCQAMDSSDAVRWSVASFAWLVMFIAPSLAVLMFGSQAVEVLRSPMVTGCITGMVLVGVSVSVVSLLGFRQGVITMTIVTLAVTMWPLMEAVLPALVLLWFLSAVAPTVKKEVRS